ncbi:ArnT family glycosyltransferase [Glaciimonas immobilis]|uniref:4-amino-4-deoxy-L-arabinose transferase-like glycosyltransferase n=1 Tax=Glaciimonas immobilis TaxID=728004 RepID=A0A840RWE8_9BURK|nr:glycosyltransferase [Glaciimonas immobilis]KAF3997562.1 glycosyltransferase [Glaciimonas immobilis]MBB5200749.1 4-amino-4-deoxy-L-arabinose transferase-like glycosyltransferase [Glaciimonas immobilis]
MKPVRLPASATSALPRWGLWALGLLYILPGLIGRDPWKNDDASSFGIMWTMAHGGLDTWLAPQIAGLPLPGESPLTFWIGAICIKVFGWLLGDPLAARLSTIIFFLIGSLSVWYATYLLGRRTEAQPLRLAFGGQPEPKDFGRTLADGAFLIYLGCLGLLLHSHETTAKSLQMSLVAYAIYLAIRLFDSRTIAQGTSAPAPTTDSVRSAALLGMTLGLLTLTRGFGVPVTVFIGLSFLAIFRQKSLVKHLLLVTLPAAVIISGAWFLAGYCLLPESHSFTFWSNQHLRQFGWPSLHAAAYYFKYGIWFAWPAWPFAGWAVYAWRQQRKTLHIALPLAIFISLTVMILLMPRPDEGVLLPLLPPLVILAAFGLPTMKRGAINAVDWFSVMTLSTCAAFIWIGWLAKETGWPAQIAKNAYKLAPGFKPGFNLTAVVIAILGSACWIMLVNWRLSRRPAVLWRAVVLSSGGVVLCWLLLMTLWLPWINYGKSYAGVAAQINAHLPSTSECVDTNVGPAQRASFAYFGNIPFSQLSQERCNILLFQDNNSLKFDDAAIKHAFSGRWKLLWSGRRPSDRDERFRLYQRVDN